MVFRELPEKLPKKHGECWTKATELPAQYAFGLSYEDMREIESFFPADFSQDRVFGQVTQAGFEQITNFKWLLRLWRNI